MHGRPLQRLVTAVHHRIDGEAFYVRMTPHPSSALSQSVPQQAFGSVCKRGHYVPAVHCVCASHGQVDLLPAWRTMPRECISGRHHLSGFVSPGAAVVDDRYSSVRTVR